MFVLTHSPPEPPGPEVTYLTGDIGEAVATARSAAGGKNLEILGADVAGQCLRRELVDEILVYVLPVLLGDGIRSLTPSSQDRPGTGQQHAVGRRHHPSVPRPKKSLRTLSGLARISLPLPGLLRVAARAGGSDSGPAREAARKCTDAVGHCRVGHARKQRSSLPLPRSLSYDAALLAPLGR